MIPGQLFKLKKKIMFWKVLNNEPVEAGFFLSEGTFVLYLKRSLLFLPSVPADSRPENLYLYNEIVVVSSYDTGANPENYFELVC